MADGIIKDTKKIFNNQFRAIIQASPPSTTDITIEPKPTAPNLLSAVALSI
jgi:hypothetical protein